MRLDAWLVFALVIEYSKSSMSISKTVKYKIIKLMKKSLLLVLDGMKSFFVKHKGGINVFIRYKSYQQYSPHYQFSKTQKVLCLMEKEIYIFDLFNGNPTIFEKSLLHFRDVFRVLLNIYFREKAPSQVFDGVLNRPMYLFSTCRSEYFRIIIAWNLKNDSTLLYVQFLQSIFHGNSIPIKKRLI